MNMSLCVERNFTIVPIISPNYVSQMHHDIFILYLPYVWELEY